MILIMGRLLLVVVVVDSTLLLPLLHGQRMLLKIGQDAALGDVRLDAAAHNVDIAFLLVEENVNNDAHTWKRQCLF